MMDKIKDIEAKIDELQDLEIKRKELEELHQSMLNYIYTGNKENTKWEAETLQDIERENSLSIVGGYYKILEEIDQTEKDIIGGYFAMLELNPSAVNVSEDEFNTIEGNAIRFSKFRNKMIDFIIKTDFEEL